MKQIRWRTPKGHIMTPKLFWRELICRLIGHDPTTDEYGHPHCKRCDETLLREGQRRPF